MHVDAVKLYLHKGENQYGEKLSMCIRIPDSPWGKIWYILDFPGGNLNIYPFLRGKILVWGEKLGCKTGVTY